MSSNVSVIETLAHTLSDSDLADAINILHAERKSRQANQLLEMKNTLAAGDIVEFYHSSKGKYIRATVKKTKTKKALVIEERNPGPDMTWDVPMGMLKKC